MSALREMAEAIALGSQGEGPERAVRLDRQAGQDVDDVVHADGVAPADAAGAGKNEPNIPRTISRERLAEMCAFLPSARLSKLLWINDRELAGLCAREPVEAAAGAWRCACRACEALAAKVARRAIGVAPYGGHVGVPAALMTYGPLAEALGADVPALLIGPGQQALDDVQGHGQLLFRAERFSHPGSSVVSQPAVKAETGAHRKTDLCRLVERVAAQAAAFEREAQP